MYDSFNRCINYLRVSVTDRCNLRCTYCMPACGVKTLHHNDILSFEEIVEVVSYAAAMGVTKVRITGGEPLVRRGITQLTGELAAIDGIHELAMTTNATLLEHFAHELASAGLQRVNISLDTIDPEKYGMITRGGDIKSVFRGIESAKKAGLNPIKINCVVQENANETDAKQVKAFCQKNGLLPRFITQMNLRTGQFSVVEGGEGGNCTICNRMRLTANGNLKPCLFTNLSYNIRELGIEKAFSLATANKPACGSINQSGQFSNLGG
jgi:GTP 3',8-cyclase